MNAAKHDFTENIWRNEIFSLTLQCSKVDRLNLSRRASGKFAQRLLGYFFSPYRTHRRMPVAKNVCPRMGAYQSYCKRNKAYALFASELINSSYTF